MYYCVVVYICHYTAHAWVWGDQLLVYFILFGCLVGADVINCTWTNEQLNCTTAPGYEFNKTVTDHFSMKIAQISNEHSGIYTCHVLGSRINGFNPCELIITPGGDTGRSTGKDDPVRQPSL